MSSEGLDQKGRASESAPAIRVCGVSKCYQIYERPEHRLKQALMPRLHRLLGRLEGRYFREFWALRDISFEVGKGETLGIIGRNGSGKSTLLQIICGTLTPTSGNVEVNGRVAALLELGSGFNPEFTGRENIYMSGAVLGLTREQIDACYEDIVAFADIGEFIEQPIKTYSSGMYVRLAFAVVAHADADILVIDEALSVGDAFFGQKCMRFLRDFQRRGTVLFVSHDAGALVNLCDRALLVEAGRLRMTGPAKDVSEAYHASLYGQEVRKPTEAVAPAADDQRKAARGALLATPPLRNDIEVFRFDPTQAGFGDGSATIVSAQLTDAAGQALSWVVGGELVKLVVSARANVDLSSAIIGFFAKDRLGQALFGDNTYLDYAQTPVAVAAGDCVEAVFEFVMPILPKGHYSFDLAIADGTYQDHRQGHWLHDGLLLESHSSSVSTGLVGIPLRSILLHAQPGVEPRGPRVGAFEPGTAGMKQER